MSPDPEREYMEAFGRHMKRLVNRPVPVDVLRDRFLDGRISMEEFEEQLPGSLWLEETRLSVVRRRDWELVCLVGLGVGVVVIFLVLMALMVFHGST